MHLVSGARPGRSGVWNEDMYFNPRMAIVDIVLDSAPAASSATARAPLAITPYQISRPHYLQDLTHLPASNFDWDDSHPDKNTFFMEFVGMDNAHQKHSTRVASDPHYKCPGCDDGPTNWNSALWDGQTIGCSINGHAYDRGSPIGKWKVNTVQEWEVAGLIEHPLHLHVNPFQITELSGMLGDLTGSGDDGTAAPHGGFECDLEYGYTCVGDWLDTLQLPTKDPRRFANQQGTVGYTPNIVDATRAKFRFTTDRFTGHEVMHCHYLDHEDLGCLSFFEIEG